jgi:hypothetical protein
MNSNPYWIALPSAIIIVLSLLLAGACTKPRRKGGGFSVSCQCWKDTTTKNYPLGNKYLPYDTSGVNPYYQDSCNAVKTKYGYDSCKVFAIAI